MKKILYMILGCIGLGVGTLGAVLPVLPTIPFLMLAAFCFARSSEKLDRWFKGTKLYKDNLEDYVAGRGMTWKTKIHSHCDAANERWLCDDGAQGHRRGLRDVGMCVAVPYCVFLFRCEDHPRSSGEISHDLMRWDFRGLPPSKI